MTVLVCGSFAFDTIMLFHDRFKHHILPEQVHILNVSFLVPQMRREFGGCAGNIAYSLQMLGGDVLAMGTVGEDFDAYAKWMDRWNVRRDHVTTVPGTFTAQAFITTDLDDNQITAFHPGAMGYSHLNSVSQAGAVSLGIVSPDGRDGMLLHARQFADAGIPFIFDPGQGMPMFDGSELDKFLEQATYLTLNDYECKLFQERTGKSLQALAERVEGLIVTRGGQGSEIYAGGRTYQVPAAAARQVVDPTGCGDAYRAGLLYGIARGIDWETTGRIAALMGAIKIEHHGTQNHHLEPAEFAERFRSEFGYSF
ncbi:MAG: carbohydrate kinase family protein [Pseudomonadota bacterium]|nr:carbohydrate kinase family protein [Pseudomonadota bacterium]